MYRPTVKHTLYSLITLFIVIIFVIFGPFGSSVIQAIGKSQNIHLHGISTNLYNGSILIKSLYYKDNNKSLNGSNITLNLSMISGIDHIHADHMDITFLNASSDGTTSYTQRTIDIDHLQIHTLALLHPIDLYKVHTVISHKQVESLFNYQYEPYSIKFTESSQEGNPLYHLSLHYDSGFIELAALQKQNQTIITSNNESDLKNLHIHIYPEKVDLNINSILNDQILKAQGSISRVNYDINAKISTQILQPNFKLMLDSQIDSVHQFYKITGTLNGTKFNVNKVDDLAVFKLHLENLASLSPYIEGDFQATADLSSDELNLSAHSDKISLPLARLEGIDFSYSHDKGLMIKANHLRNSLVSIHEPTLTFQQIDDRYELSFTAHDSERPLSIIPYHLKLSATPVDDHYEVNINQFTFMNSTQSWSLTQQKPIKISRQKIDTGQVTFVSTKKSVIDLHLIYDLSEGSWTLKNTLEHLNITFHSHELFDYDTEMILHSLEANGHSTISKKPFSPIELDGEYNLTNIRADIIDVVPYFLFPLDYHINDGHAHIDSSGYDAKLYSDQGTLSIKSNYKMTQMQSDSIQFDYNNHRFKCGFDLSHDDFLTSGQLEVFELTMSVEQFDGFLIFPRDIEIIGERNIVKPNSRGLNTEINIYANAAPVQLYGFNGMMNAKLDYSVSKEGLESVTGTCSMSDPKLIILNRLIPFSHLEVHFDHNRWLDGNLDIFLSEDITLNRPNQDTINRIDASIGGTFNYPSSNIVTTPSNISKFEALLHLFSQSTQLPKGNENHQLLELASGLTQNDGFVFFIDTMNYVANLMRLDISIRPGYDDKQSFSENIKQSEIVIHKALSEDISIALSHQFSNETNTASIKYMLSPQTALEGQISREKSGINLLYHD